MLMPSPTPTNELKAVRPSKIGGYELVRKLGQGTMGKVYLARQPHLDRLVALKILPDNIARNQVFIDRFQREARASAKLNHPNIVQGIDGGFDEGTGKWYFAMEFVDGLSLGQILRKERTIVEKRALKIVRGIARGLASAYKIGIVHRDIKPDNIVLTKEGEPKLADLGLAQYVQEDSSLTQNGTAIGTPHYMAPEQAAGELEKIDTRTDIYALGATLYHLVTGRTPFTGRTSASIMTKHLMERALPANQVNTLVSAECSELIEKMMEKDREERVNNPFELLAALDRVVKGQRPFVQVTRKPAPDTVQAQPVGSRPKSSRLSGRPGSRHGARKPVVKKRKVKRRKGTFVRKRTTTSVTPSAPQRPVERRVRNTTSQASPLEVNKKAPSQVKGFFLDLIVIFVMGGVLSGGYYYFKIYGKGSTPPGASVTVPVGSQEQVKDATLEQPVAPKANVEARIIRPVSQVEEKHPLSENFVELPPVGNRKPVIILSVENEEVEFPFTAAPDRP